MSISGTFLVVITAAFLKPLLSSNYSLQLPTVAAYDQYNNVSPFGEADDGALFLTLRFPQLLANTKETNLDIKRQFDPWGGKRYLKSEIKGENIGRKRQFSPWGGKRSFLKSSQFSEDDLSDADAQLTDLYLSGNKRNFNSWGGKRGFNSWGGKRHSNPEGGKRFNSWGGKRNFNAWGGKRSTNNMNKIFDVLSSTLKKNANMGSKRQAFNSWGGKRSFNSWGGKRAFNSWGGKRAIEFELEPKELNVSEDNSIPQTYKGIIEGTETNIR